MHQISSTYNWNNKVLNYVRPFSHLLLQLRFSELVQSHQKPQNQSLEAFPQHPWYWCEVPQRFQNLWKYITPRVKYFNRILRSFNCWREVIYLNHFKTKDTSCYIQWQPRHIHSFVIHAKMQTTSLAAYFVTLLH